MVDPATTSRPAPAPAPGPVPYVGSRISLISKSAIRYVGTLYTIDTHASTVALKDVRSFGTEGRPREGGPVEPSDRVYSYIVFRGPDILDLQFLTADSVPTSTRVPPAPESQQSSTSQQPQKLVQPPKPQQAQQSQKVPQAQPLEQAQQQRQSDQRQPPHQAPLAAPSSPKITEPKPEAVVVPQPAAPQQPFRGPTPRAWGPPPVPGRRNDRVLPPLDSRDRLTNGFASHQPAPAVNSVALPQQDSEGRNPRQRPRGRARAPNGPRNYGGQQNSNWRRGPGITIPEEDYDFESMLEKFDKASVAEKMGNAKEDSPGVSADQPVAFPPVIVRYDKAKSFFDELLPEKEVRVERVNAAQRRATDFETFGETGPGYHSRNGYRNGRGRRGRSRGGSRGRNRNESGPRPGHQVQGVQGPVGRQDTG